MHFSDALTAVIHHRPPTKAYRLSWQSTIEGPEFIFLVPGSTFKVNRPPLLGIYEEGTEIQYHGHVDAKYHDGDEAGPVSPWQPTQDDMLAEDWEILP